MNNPHKTLPLATRGTPPGEGRGAVVMLHGRGRDTEDILSLSDRLGDGSFSYLAPPAREGTWYPESFMAPIEQNEPYLSHALEVVDDLVGELLAQGVDQRQIVLAGFSQGACLAAEYAVRNVGPYGGVLLFTGGLIGPPGTRWEYPGSFEGTPVFLGTSDVDGFVPVERVRESAEIFGERGADVTLSIYPGMGHVVNDEEIEAARQILRGVG